MSVNFFLLLYENQLWEMNVISGPKVEQFGSILAKIKEMIPFIDLAIGRVEPNPVSKQTYNFEVCSNITNRHNYHNNKYFKLLNSNNHIMKNSVIRVTQIAKPNNNVTNGTSNAQTITTNNQNRDPRIRRNESVVSETTRFSRFSNESNTQSTADKSKSSNSKSVDNGSTCSPCSDKNQSSAETPDSSKSKTQTNSNNNNKSKNKNDSQLIKHINNEICEKFSTIFYVIKNYSENNCDLLTDFEWNYIIHNKLCSKGFKNFDKTIWKTCFNTYVEKYTEALNKCNSFSSAKSRFAFFEEFNKIYFNERNSRYNSVMSARKEFLKKFDVKWDKEIITKRLPKVEDNSILRKTYDKQKKWEILRTKHNGLQKQLELYIDEIKGFNLIVQAISALKNQLSDTGLYSKVSKLLIDCGLNWKPEKCESILKEWIEFYEKNFENYTNSMKSNNRCVEYIFEFLNIITIVNLKTVFYYNTSFTKVIESIERKAFKHKPKVQYQLKINTNNLDNIVKNAQKDLQNSYNNNNKRRIADKVQTTEKHLQVINSRKSNNTQSSNKHKKGVPKQMVTSGPTGRRRLVRPVSTFNNRSGDGVNRNSGRAQNSTALLSTHSSTTISSNPAKDRDMRREDRDMRREDRDMRQENGLFPFPVAVVSETVQPLATTYSNSVYNMNSNFTSTSVHQQFNLNPWPPIATPQSISRSKTWKSVQNERTNSRKVQTFNKKNKPKANIQLEWYRRPPLPPPPLTVTFNRVVAPVPKQTNTTYYQKQRKRMTNNFNRPKPAAPAVPPARTYPGGFGGVF